MGSNDVLDNSNRVRLKLQKMKDVVLISFCTEAENSSKEAGGCVELAFINGFQIQT
jgi:hypothetical protein